jgi:hypothetical protein
LDGVFVNWAQYDGVRVVSAGLDGVAVGVVARDGVFVSSAGDNGVYVDSAGDLGVYANTTQASGQWGFYTPDAIHGSNVLLHSLSLVAQASGVESLTPGDLVAVAGVADPFPGSVVNVPLVRLADSASKGIVGVVASRLALTPRPSRPQADAREALAEPDAPYLRNADGPALAGDYVAITIFGAAQVRVDSATTIEAGQRLTAADLPGHARALRTLKVQLADGAGTMDMLETAPVLGTALGPAVNGLVWVLVKPQ